MKKKKVLVHGTLETLKKFFSDASSRDFEIVALLSEEPEKISGNIEILAPQSLPKFIYKMIDGIIFTGERNTAEFFLKQGMEPPKIILWNAERGWEIFSGRDKDGVQVIFFCGLEFHIRNEDDAKFFNEMVWRLRSQWQTKNLPPQMYPAVLAQIYQRSTGKPLDLNNPKTFTEKLQWLKIYDATPLKSRLADKYLVRRWVAEKIGEQYLIPLLGVWDNFDDINFDELPDQFVLKCNHGSGMNVIVRDKKTFDKQNAREKINAWLAVDYGNQYGLELHYTRIERKIIAEKFMADKEHFDLVDYKLFCFDGKPAYFFCATNRSTDLRFDYFDMDWKHMDFEQKNHPNNDHPEKIPRPKNFKLMKKLAAKLAEGFAHVRVDFFEIDGKVYFGEMTFVHDAGIAPYKSEGTDEYLGSLLKLPVATPPPDLISRHKRKLIPCRKFAARDFFCYHVKNFGRNFMANRKKPRLERSLARFTD